MIKHIFYLLLILSSLSTFPQSKLKSFFNLGRPEKCWVITHPFSAGFALKMAAESKRVCDTLQMDGDKNGGRLDAFRHAYWMALLAQKFGSNKAVKLGKKHEKSNYIQYKKGSLEDGTLPDSVSCLMDLKNNSIGAEIGAKNRQLTRIELINIIKKEIENGKMFIIKKNKAGEFLDCKGNVINVKSLPKTWGIPKCLINSNY